ncbi:hypothetical protein Scep_004768 [Stephania cephalantha]|uniref:Dof zinc finger protein n=1 Tax=Stephania cephalantha TaxID=152367 RepID=A0AAP0KUQ0_9MAGN
MASNSSSSTMELDVLTFPKTVVQQERRLRPQQDQALKCPRCDSSNTKFCYYNNYSLSQPRYFCKGCRRYWTQGGTLRNVPVGGGCRKNKRSSSSSSKRASSSSSSSSQLDHHHHHHQLSLMANVTTNNVLNPLSTFTTSNNSFDSNDLTLAFARVLHNKQNPSCAIQLGFDHQEDHSGHFLANSTTTTATNMNNMMSSTTTSGMPYVDALRGGYLDTQNIGFHHHNNFKNYGFGNEEVGEDGGEGDHEMVRFPYEEGTTKQQELCKGRGAMTNNNGENSRGFWNFPWHIGGVGGGGGVGEDHHHHHQGSSISGVDSGRDCWINGIGSSWHGLINSPLM